MFVFSVFRETETRKGGRQEFLVQLQFLYRRTLESENMKQLHESDVLHIYYLDIIFPKTNKTSNINTNTPLHF